MNNKKISVHQKTFDIAWGDMDALGHVNNARYFDYFQEARVDWLQQINISLSAPTGPVIVQTSCTYFKPLIYPATVTIPSNVADNCGRLNQKNPGVEKASTVASILSKLISAKAHPR